MHKEIEDLKKNINLKTFYLVDKFSDESKKSTEFGTGLITSQYIRKIFPEQSDDLLIMSCGSKIMNNTYVKPMLLHMGYNENNIHLY